MRQMSLIPDTQRDAYWSIDRSKSRRTVFNVVKDSVYGVTLFEIVRKLQWPVNSISGRITELSHAGVIEDTGKRRVNPLTGKKAIVWGVCNEADAQLTLAGSSPAQDES